MTIIEALTSANMAATAFALFAGGPPTPTTGSRAEAGESLTLSSSNAVRWRSCRTPCVCNHPQNFSASGRRCK